MIYNPVFAVALAICTLASAVILFRATRNALRAARVASARKIDD
jgi:hypothetical protein